MILAKQTVEQLPQRKPKTTPTKRVRKVTKTKLNPRAIYLMIFVVAFLAGIYFTSRYAQLAETGYAVDKIKDRMQTVELQNQSLSVQVDGLKSLDRIEKVAVEELGMIKPEGVQFIAVEDKAVQQKNLSPAVSTEATGKGQEVKVASNEEGDGFLGSLTQLVSNAKAAAQTAAAGE